MCRFTKSSCPNHRNEVYGLGQEFKTLIRQQKTGNIVSVTVEPAVDVNGSKPLAGAAIAPSTVVDLIVDGMGARSLTFNNQELSEYSDLKAFENAESGWISMGNNHIRAKSGKMDVEAQKIFVFDGKPAAATTSVNFVCDNAETDVGEKIYVLGNIPALGDSDPERAIALYPSIDYDYITNPPPVKVADPVGADAPIWTGVVADLPPNQTFEWQCLRRSIFGTAVAGEKNTHTTPAKGYGGRSYGTIIEN